MSYREEVTEADRRVLQYVDSEWRTTAFIFSAYDGHRKMSGAGKKRRKWVYYSLERLRAAGLIRRRDRIDNRGEVYYWRRP